MVQVLLAQKLRQIASFDFALDCPLVLLLRLLNEGFLLEFYLVFDFVQILVWVAFVAVNFCLVFWDIFWFFGVGFCCISLGLNCLLNQQLVLLGLDRGGSLGQVYRRS